MYKFLFTGNHVMRTKLRICCKPLLILVLSKVKCYKILIYYLKFLTDDKLLFHISVFQFFLNSNTIPL